MLTSSDSYPYRSETYMVHQNQVVAEDSKKSLGQQVVADLVCSQNPKHHMVFFDNFFTSYHLLRDMPMSKPLEQSEKTEFSSVLSSIFKSRGRKDCGFYNSRLDEFLCIVQWKDNKVVYIKSNHY